MKSLVKIARSILLSKKKGSTTIEWIILCPIIFIMIFFSIMFIVFVLDYYLLSNVSSRLATQMNLGDNGLKAYTSGSPTISFDEYGHSAFFTPAKTGSGNASIYVTNTADGYFENAAYYHISKYNNANMFAAPFCAIKEVNIRVYNGSGECHSHSTDPNTTEAGDMIEAEIVYDFIGLFKTHAVGYAFVI